MKSILENLMAAMPEKTYAGLTTVWDYHNAGSWEYLLKNKRTNLHRFISDKKDMSDLYLKDGITIFTGAKGRSQHSATEVIVFRGNHEDNGGTFFSFSELVELGVR